MRSGYYFFVAFFFLNLCVIQIPAQELPLKLRGTLQDENGFALTGLEVRLLNAAGTVDYSDADGYELDILGWVSRRDNLFFINEKRVLLDGNIRRVIYDISSRHVLSEDECYLVDGHLEGLHRLPLKRNGIYIQVLTDRAGHRLAQKFQTVSAVAQAPDIVPESSMSSESSVFRLKGDNSGTTGNTGNTGDIGDTGDQMHRYELSVKGYAANGFNIDQKVEVKGFYKSQQEHTHNIYINTHPENYVLLQGRITELLNDSKPEISTLELFNADESIKIEGDIDSNNQYRILLPKNQAGQLLALHLEGTRSMPIFHGITIDHDTVLIATFPTNSRVFRVLKRRSPFFNISSVL